MNNMPNGGPASPPTHDPKNHPSGMTLRDYFAGQALVGFASSLNGSIADASWFEQHAAAVAYRVSDAMITARGGE